jgi:hypothetical protein
MSAESEIPAAKPADPSPALGEESKAISDPTPTEPAAQIQVPIEEPKPAPVPSKVDPAPEPVVQKPVKNVQVQSPPSTPLSQLFAELPSILKSAEHDEMWGVSLSEDSHVPTTIVLEKFLRANDKDVVKAKTQLTDALKWRKKINPRKLLEEFEFDSTRFGGLGYVTTYSTSEFHGKEIVTWNIYGAVKDNKATFGNVEE